MNEQIVKIGVLITMVFCIMGNTAIACTWINNIFKNPQATKDSILPVLLASGTSELVIVFCMACLAKWVFISL